MTNRDFYVNVVNANLSDEMTQFAEAAIAKLDATNEKRREAASKKAAENRPYIDAIVGEILGDQPLTATDVAAALTEKFETTFSVQKASSLLRTAAAEGLIEAQDVKIPKKGKQKGYTVVA